MKKTEKWKTHLTRENIFINEEDGLMYERLSSGWHNRLPGQKMTELQNMPQNPFSYSILRTLLFPKSPTYI